LHFINYAFHIFLDLVVQNLIIVYLKVLLISYQCSTEFVQRSPLVISLLHSGTYYLWCWILPDCEFIQTLLKTFTWLTHISLVLPHWECCAA